MNYRALKPLAIAIALGNLCVALPAHADEAELRARVEKLSAELELLKAEMKAMHSQTEAIASQQEKVSSTPVNAQTSQGVSEKGVAGDRAVQQVAAAVSQATLWGYGEINYNRPRNDGSQTQMDLRRAVFGIGYRFNENTRLMSEFEVEHAVASADDSGEMEVEQFYIDHKLSDSANVKAGLFLIPAGLLNESHEPTHYYGVERNFVETAIIPSTWREGGAAVYGSTEFGLAWDVGLTTGPDLGKWDSASTEGRESPLGSIHQELQLAKARDLSTYVALNYRGLPGFTVGTTVFTGKIAQGNPDIRVAADSRLTLWDAHTRWTPGNFDLAAVYAKGTISDTKDLNLTFVGNPTPVPKEFYGWYTQAAYKVWQSGTYSLSPFVRYERFNTASAYAAMPVGLEVDTAPTETVATYGVNFYLNPNVVIKADYQHFSEDTDLTRFDLGLGVSF
jgi:hypothetical protein